MMEINNLTRFKIDKKSFTQVAKKVLSGENKGKRARNNLRSDLGGETLSLAFVNKLEMQKLNKKHRGKNKPTDVLAFGDIPNSKFQIPNSSFLGEIVICPKIVKKNVPIAQRQSRIHDAPTDGRGIGTRKYKSAFEKELIKVFIHGILHLLGYDHENSEKEAKLMEVKQEKYLNFKLKI
ncbi:MAG: rRNA maturation RNase YbeY [bacterium]